MDVQVARTFLEIIRCGSFVGAAERLFVTQTAVSARIQGLEQQLGCKLFIREHGGVRLTPPGERFVRFATELVRAWDQAREEVARPHGQENSLAVGAELSLWDPLLIDWLVWMGETRPHIELRAEVDLAESLTRRVERGGLDIALVYTPEYAAGLQNDLLLEERLVLVTTNKRSSAGSSRYIRVGWGTDFLSKHDAAFPDHAHQSMFVGLGPLALQFILRAGGTGYFRRTAVQPHIDSGRLSEVLDAPEFLYPIYSVRRREDRPIVYEALSDLKLIVNDETYRK